MRKCDRQMSRKEVEKWHCWSGCVHGLVEKREFDITILRSEAASRRSIPWVAIVGAGVCLLCRVPAGVN